MESILKKIDFYELFSIFFAGSIITYLSILICHYHLGISLNYRINVSSTLLYILISCFVGFIFQEIGSFVVKNIVYSKNKLVNKAYAANDNNNYMLSTSEFNKLEEIFKEKDIKDVVMKYNLCKYYLQNKGNTTTMDKDLALSSMSRSFAICFMITTILYLGIIIVDKQWYNLALLFVSIMLTIIMWKRFKRFAILRYVHVFRTYLYSSIMP